MSEDPTAYAVAIPDLSFETKGEIAIITNFEEYATLAKQWLGEINRNLRSNEEFGQAAADVKTAKENEDRLAAYQEALLEKAGTLNEEMKKASDLSAVIRDARLELTRQIDKAKSDLKAKMIDGALAGIKCDPGKRELFRPGMDAAIKGLKTTDTIREALRVAVQVANDKVDRNKRALDAFEKLHGNTMTADRPSLEVADPVFVEGELARRRDRANAAAEAARIKAEADDERKRLEEVAARAMAEADAVKAEAKRATQEGLTGNGTPPAVAAGIAAKANAANPGPPVMLDELPHKEIADQPPTQNEEWKLFEAAAIATFHDLKAKVGALAHEQNITAAEILSKATNAGWKEAKKIAKGECQP